MPEEVGGTRRADRSQKDFCLHITVNDEAQIDVETARRNDCLSNTPHGNARYWIIAGGDEPAGWIEQSRLYANVVSTAGNLGGCPRTRVVARV